MKDLYYIDSHCHLNDDTILSHFNEVLSDALANNVKKIIVIGWDADSSKKALEISHQYDNVYCAVGIHPCNLKDVKDEDYELIEKMALDKKVVAIGEIGFDYHWDDTTKEEQFVGFIKQLDIAKKVNKPVIIHSREADNDTFNVLKNNFNNNLGGIIHAYSGSLELAKEYIKMNYLLGIGGVLTFKNAKVLPGVVKEISLDYLVTETDSPYLAPTPHRGEENGPKYIPLIVDKIKEIKDISKEEIMEKIISNINRLFKI